MVGKDTSSSPKKKKQKRNSSDVRVDGLLPNTLYLINLRSDYKKRKSTEARDENLSCSIDDSLKYSLNEEGKSLNKESTKIEKDSTNLNENELGVSESLNANINNSHNLHKEDADGDSDTMVCCKSHSCFVGMDYSCLKYDLSSCSGTHFSKDSPDYSSFVISNIFLKKSSDLQFDEASLYDASWEVESVHLCKQICKFLSSQPTNTSDTPDIHETNTPSATKSTSSNTSEVSNSSATNCNYKEEHTADAPDSSIPATLNQSGTAGTRILDGFCGIGGNFVHFANHFDFSLGVELDKNRVNICKNNLGVYEVSGSYSIVNDDFFKFAEEFLEDPKGYFESKLNRADLYRADQPQFDWVFLSPPWGGSNYKGSNNDDIYIFEEYFPQFYRCLELSSRIGKNVTLFLPRSQSVVEIVQAASLNNFKFVLIDSYLMLPTFTKIRCCMIHLLSDVDMFTANFTIQNAKKMSPKDLFSPSLAATSANESFGSKHTEVTDKDSSDEELSLLKGSNNVNILCVNSYSYDLKHLNLMKIGLLMLLNEYNLNVYKKLSLLLEHLSVIKVLDLVNNAVETYYSNGLTTLRGDKRTLGGTFFYLLKVNYNNTYKSIEKTLKRA